MCKKILENKQWYQPVLLPQLHKYRDELFALIEQARETGIIDSNTSDFLKVSHPRIPTFYALPKVHKSLSNPPELNGLVLDSDCILVGLDVEALYMSIPYDRGLAALTSIFELIHKPIDEHHGFIVEALRFVLYHNVFLFDGTYYLQRQGVAMGAKCAPSYANLYLGEWECHVFSNEAYRCTCATYFDGTVNHDRGRLEFLDIELKKDLNGGLNTSLFRKKTASNSFLHARSMHPPKCIDGIPKGQYLRLRRICSTEEEFKQEAYKLYQRFKARGYKTRYLHRVDQDALSKTREDLLYKPQRPKSLGTKQNDQGYTRLIFTYNDNDEGVRSVIHKHWVILSRDPIMGRLTPGTFRCGTCEQCQFLKISNKFGGDHLNFKMYHYISCTTTCVVYLFTCHYGSIYVGKTKRPLKRRIYEHIRDIRNCNLMSSIAKHIYCSHNGHYSGCYFQEIDRLHGDIRGSDLDNKLLQLETTWIFRLNTYRSEIGLNGHLNFQAFVHR
ncbi:hypothetical protein XELAEV_18000535mg [Xenopus laevis]|nr:hypothetical protein XELAEV_18000535mg [Xenopus laevis]